MTEIMTGGCQCGRVRYTAQIASNDAYLCHCRMCQRATGGVSIAFVNAAKANVTWETEPDWYTSSPIARRPFCSKCGTPLGFSFPDGSNIDLTVGSFDEPSRFKPTSHFGAESLHEAWLDTRDLPRSRCEENPKLVERWAKVGMNVPD
jgi:hypothetical protein